MIFGLDSAPPSLIYEESSGIKIDNIKEIIAESHRKVLRSSYPPITVPAWMIMFTGKSAGELGIYGFRHRKPGDVSDSYIVNSRYIRYPTIWDELGKSGLRCGVFGVPPTYPPRPLNGFIITDFTTPGPESRYSFPPWIKGEIEKKFGKLIFDVTYRSENKDLVAKEIIEMLKQHLSVNKYLIERKKWDFYIYMEIAVDRVHHAFWRYFDKKHPKYAYHPKYSNVIPEFYNILDKGIGEIKKTLPKDTIIVFASDHGAKSMKGAFAINEWLKEKGYLKLKKEPKKPGTDLTEEYIDMGKTIAWAWGGYYSRVFINLKNREKNGIVEEKDYESVIEDLKKDIMKIKGEKGEEWKNIVHRPSEIYPQVNGDPPDLMVYLDDLNWRPAGTIGWNSPYLEENDRGPDDMVHDWYGIFSVYDPEGTLEKGDHGEISILDVKDFLVKLSRADF